MHKENFFTHKLKTKPKKTINFNDWGTKGLGHQFKGVLGTPFAKKIIYSEIYKYFLTEKQDIYNVLLICYYFFTDKMDKILNF